MVQIANMVSFNLFINDNRSLCFSRDYARQRRKMSNRCRQSPLIYVHRTSGRREIHFRINFSGPSSFESMLTNSLLYILLCIFISVTDKWETQVLRAYVQKDSKGKTVKYPKTTL